MKIVICLSIFLAVGYARSLNGNNGRGHNNGRHNRGWGNGDESDGDYNGNGNKGNRNGRNNGRGNIVSYNCQRQPSPNVDLAIRMRWLERCCIVEPCNGWGNAGSNNGNDVISRSSTVHKFAASKSIKTTTTTTTRPSPAAKSAKHQVNNSGWVGNCSTGGRTNFFTIVPGTGCAYDFRTNKGPQEGDYLYTKYCDNGKVFDLNKCRCNDRNLVNLHTCRS